MLSRLKNLISSDDAPATETVEVPKGPIRVHVQAEEYRKNKSASVKLNTPVRFSLSPKNSFQIQKNWPYGEFYNVNTYPNTETTSKNWLGYVAYEGKPTAAQIADLVNSGKAVSCWGEYEIEDGEVNIVLTIPKKL